MKRSFGFDFAFSMIWSSFVDILLLPLRVENLSPNQQLNLPCLFPMYAAFPRSKYYKRGPTPSSHLSSSGLAIRLTYSVHYSRTRTTVDLPGAMTLTFLYIQCSQTPPESPTTIAFRGRLL